MTAGPGDWLALVAMEPTMALRQATGRTEGPAGPSGYLSATQAPQAAYGAHRASHGHERMGRMNKARGQA